ncbi:MAG: lactate utilization protein [Bacteroidales bacterium]|nr:lactate utilization protein [Bacteroidales bacterium]
MKDNRLKEQVMKDIREALIDKNEITDRDAPSTNSGTFIMDDNDDLSVLFAKKFTQAGGTLHYCYTEADIKKRILEIQSRYSNVAIGCASENLTTFLQHLNIDNCCSCNPSQRYPLGATLCEALLAWQGSIVISSNLGLGTTIPALPDATIVLAFTSQVVPDWEEANQRIKQLYPSYPEQIIITNPASYAYRKGTQKLYLILIEDEN